MKNSQKDFIKGYACAVAVLVESHGCTTEAETVYACNFYTVDQLINIGADAHDIELLAPIIKEIERKKAATKN